MVSFSVVSEIAIVPDSECRMPTLIVSSAAMAPVTPAPIMAAVARAPTVRLTLFEHMEFPLLRRRRGSLGGSRAVDPSAGSLVRSDSGMPRDGPFATLAGTFGQFLQCSIYVD